MLCVFDRVAHRRLCFTVVIFRKCSGSQLECKLLVRGVHFATFTYDFSWEVLKFPKFTYDYSWEVLKFAKFTYDYSWQVLKFVKLPMIIAGTVEYSQK